MAAGLCTHGGSLLGDAGAEGVLSGVAFEYQGGEGTQCIVCVCVWGVLWGKHPYLNII